MGAKKETAVQSGEDRRRCGVKDRGWRMMPQLDELPKFLASMGRKTALATTGQATSTDRPADSVGQDGCL
jgi:hypothetical protein